MAIEIEVIINRSGKLLPEGFDPAGYAWSAVLRRNGATEMRTNYFTGSALGAPTPLDILSSLCMDAGTIYQSWCNGPTSFEAWANEMGYDEDSRKAERTYNLCKSEADRLRTFLGDAKIFAAFLDSDPEENDALAWEPVPGGLAVVFHPDRVEGHDE